MKKIKLQDGYLEVHIEKSPEISIPFVKNCIVRFNMFRKVDENYYESTYRINLTKYDDWYNKHKERSDFSEVERRAYGVAKLLQTVRVSDFFPDISCGKINFWFGVLAHNKRFITHKKERKID